MSSINRFSSRRQRLDKAFLADRLRNAQKYDRIAGYFNGSLLELVGEELESITGKIRVVCNSAVQSRDIASAKAAVSAQWKSWAPSSDVYLMEDSEAPEELPLRNSFARLYRLLISKKLEVRVLPDDAFGLLHGKAGVVTMQDGTKTSFMGSANDTEYAWKANYELVWEDPSQEAIEWTQQEFDALWQHPLAYSLSDAVITDIGRLGKRSVVPASTWVENPDPASAVVESPVFRKELGLWQHQKYFVKIAFDAHRGPLKKARFVLADQVGLGKTIQLAMTAELIALTGERPILIMCPKTLVWQWQDELKDLLDLPAAVWDGKRWIDENKLEYPVSGVEGIRKCPRRVGIVSTGLVIMGTEARDQLLKMEYDCVILDEAHKARRKNLSPQKDNQSAEPNNLLAFMNLIATKTRSLLLATATPVQLRPIEAYDLLAILNHGDESVLGNNASLWRKDPAIKLQMIMGQDTGPMDAMDQWSMMTNPLPSSGDSGNDSGRAITLLRRNLSIPEEVAALTGTEYLGLSAPERLRISRLFSNFIAYQNPYIRRIIRRTREQLESTLDPQTNEPFLKKIGVELFGENSSESVFLPAYLSEAYELAEAFCKSVGQRQKSAGFLRTLVLRRLGSSLAAGMNTAKRMLGMPLDVLVEAEESEEPDESEETPVQELSSFAQNLTTEEKGYLKRMVESLSAFKEADPKFRSVLVYLKDKGWLKDGCIIFSQYRDSLQGLMQFLSSAYPEETIALYSGDTTSGLMRNGKFRATRREKIKMMVRNGELRLLLGTDAASEGLNLQRLGNLINLDLPWNPTRLEQRKGRIQRIGQQLDSVRVYNMRYKGSVEDRVHDLLSSRLQEIFELFGQLPDVLEDVWVHAALGEIETAQQKIDDVPRVHPFKVKNTNVETVDWESCSVVLSEIDKKRILGKGW